MLVVYLIYTVYLISTKILCPTRSDAPGNYAKANVKQTGDC